MYAQDDYKIPKEKKQVQVYLNDANKYAQKFIFFVNERSKYSNSPQSIKEFLNENILFIPAIQIMPNTAEVFTILNKNEIYYVVDDSVSYEESKLKKGVSLILNNGIRLDVSILKDKPKDKQRLLDHLNSNEHFLEFIIGSSVIYLNRSCISKVICND